MEKIISKLTVFFEEPFWIGVYEREFRGKYEIAKITFGAEPKGYELYELMLKNYNQLRFSPSFETTSITEKHLNPKRLQREIKRQLQDVGIGTKAQQALKLQHEQDKKERNFLSREQRDAEKEKQFQLRLEKNKAKHRGH